MAVVMSPGSASIPCPVAPSKLAALLHDGLRPATSYACLLDTRGDLLASSGDPGAHAAPTPAVRFPVTVCTDQVAELCVFGGDDVDVHRATVLCQRIGDTWETSVELESLSSELLHTYEEMHLLYELGEALTGQLTLAQAAQLLLENLLAPLHAAWVELRLQTAQTPVFVAFAECARVRPSGRHKDERTLSTTLRGAGTIVGTLAMGREGTDDPFSSADVKLLDSVGTLAGNALRTASLYEELLRQSERVRERESHLRTVLENIADAIITVDERGVIESFNPAAVAIFGYQLDEVIGRPFTTLLDATHVARFKGTFGQSLGRDHTRQAVGVMHELAARRKDGAIRSVELSISETRLAAQQLYVVSLRDITDRRQFELAIEHQALHDLLTDLPNRTLLHDRLQQAILGTKRTGKSLALLVLDLDGFKEINDTFGHHYGDMLLQVMARRLTGLLRDSDTVARLGGDEIAIVLPSADHHLAPRLAEQILQTLEAPVELEGHTLRVGASLGIAYGPDHGMDANTLLRCADVAMYVAKRNQTGFGVYTADLDEHSPSRLSLISELRKGIEEGELRLFYQPKVTYRGRRVECLEALVRWEHPGRGLLPPDVFVPLAERTGLIRQLTLWVLETALRQCSEWRTAGMDVPVAVNISTRNLHDIDLVSVIPAMLQRHNVPAHLLRLEITESSLVLQPPRAMATLTRLRELGVLIAIDDFGTGYSSLTYVKRLPVSEIKIDKSFIRHMVRNDHDLAIVRSTVNLGHDLGLTVTAEGVEDQATWDMLDGFGCDVVQGYYVSRPLDAASITRWLENSGYELSDTTPAPEVIVTRVKQRARESA